MDIIGHAAGGSGVGIFESATAAGRLAIGADSDQYLTAPAMLKACILTSMLKRVDAAVQAYVQAVSEKATLARVMRFDLTNEWVGYSKMNPIVQPFVATADRLRERIVAGEIKVSDR